MSGSLKIQIGRGDGGGGGGSGVVFFWVIIKPPKPGMVFGIWVFGILGFGLALAWVWQFHN